MKYHYDSTKQKRVRSRDGSVRRSQVIGTYGPGALVNLLEHSVIISSLKHWREKGEAAVIQERRLLEQDCFKSFLEIDQHEPFQYPPSCDDKSQAAKAGIPGLEFPWMSVCPACKRLLHYKDADLDGSYSDGVRRHNCRPGGVKVVPMRFVGACAAGHIQDYPWHGFVHGKGECRGSELYFYEDPGGDFNKIRIRCGTCGKQNYLGAAKNPNTAPGCKGLRPWLPFGNNEECSNKIRLISRTASSAYFPVTVSSLTIPEPDDRLILSLRRDAQNLAEFSDDEVFLDRYLQKKHSELIEVYGVDEVKQAVQKIIKGDASPRLELRTAEYLRLRDSPPNDPSKVDSTLDDVASEFRARCLPPDPSIANYVKTVTLVERLRETRVQLGFTRLSPIEHNNQGLPQDDVKWAPLSEPVKWLPGVTIKGEGVFLEFQKDALRSWEERPEVQSRREELMQAWYEHEVQQGNAEDDSIDRQKFPGIRKYLIHSIAHLLIKQISLRCGYSASAIRERLYVGAFGPNDSQIMNGILLYTGTPGSEGTLGGLVEEGKRIHIHLQNAIEDARLCSGDPICSSHICRPAENNEPNDERYLEGAACHGCLYVAEPSCEYFNHYLDRCLVAETVSQGKGLAFFE